MKNLKPLILAIFFLTISISTNKAQNPLPDETPIKINTYLVNIPVIATDKDGRRIAGLTKDNFTIFQNGIKQPIEYFASEESPMNVAILIDTSGSTGEILENIKSAALNFLQILRPEDKAIIVSFDGQFKILSSLTAERKDLEQAISKARLVQPGGYSMYDAIYEIVQNQFKAVKGRKAVILLTDGGEFGQQVSSRNLLNTLIESDVLVYPIIFKSEDNLFRNLPKTKLIKQADGQKLSVEEVRNKFAAWISKPRRFTESLAVFTGGKSLINESTDFQESFQSIANELKKQYLLGFYPENIEAGEKQQITVEVNVPDVTIRSKKIIRLNVTN